jgi:hypothetical protein
MRPLLRLVLFGLIAMSVSPLRATAVYAGVEQSVDQTDQLFPLERVLAPDAMLVGFAVINNSSASRAFDDIIGNLARLTLRENFDGFDVRQSWRVGYEPNRQLRETVGLCLAAQGTEAAPDCRLVVKFYKFDPSKGGSPTERDSADNVMDAHAIVARLAIAGS